MKRTLGAIKVVSVFAVDFCILSLAFDDIIIPTIIIGGILLYVWLGGYLLLFREGAVRCEQLPSQDRIRLETAKQQLVNDVRRVSYSNISRLQLYLIPGDDSMQATAYGANCISISRGMIENADPMTLNAVLAHEVSHILNFDAEFNRALLCSIMVVIAVISIVSATLVVVLFVVFLLLGAFKSFFGFIAFRGTRSVTGGLFRLLQKGIVILYRTLTAIAIRQEEYRCDQYAYELGYGIQLLQFLSLFSGSDQTPMTLQDALYRSHPTTEKRIARLEEYLSV